MPTLPANFEETIAKALRGEIEKVVSEEAEKAAETAKANVKRRVMELTHNVSANVIKKLGFEFTETSIVIRMKENPFA